MSVDPRFLESLIHARAHRVCGVRLAPYSVAHRLCLGVFAPRVLLGVGVRWPDLEVAVTLCSRHDPFAVLPRLGRARSWRGLAWRYLWPGSLRLQARSFAAYLDDYDAAPEFWDTPDEGGGSSGKTPLEARVAIALTKCGLSLAEAWRCPAGLASWLLAARSEMESGESDIITPEDREQIAALEAMQAAPPVDAEGNI